MYRQISTHSILGESPYDAVDGLGTTTEVQQARMCAQELVYEVPDAAEYANLATSDWGWNQHK